jgi:type IV pilus assembly protein PilY1
LFQVSPAQPITTKLLLAIVPQPTGLPRVMVDFGTGRKFPLTNSTPQSYATGSHTLYGIWDWNMSGWNSLAAAAARVASLSAPQSVSNSTLAAQTFTSPTPDVRDVSANVVCWAGSSACKSGNTQFGWMLALPATNEQVVFNPLLYQNAFVVNTTVPAGNSPLNCAANTDTGWTVAVDLGSGGLISGFFKNYNDTHIGALRTNGTGTSFGFNMAGQSWLLTQSLGNGCPTCGCPPGMLYCSNATKVVAPSAKRLTWIQRR